MSVVHYGSLAFFYRGFGMFLTFYGAREDQLVDRSCRKKSGCGQSHVGSRSVSKTAKQLFFIIEDPAEIGDDGSMPIIH